MSLRSAMNAGVSGLGAQGDAIGVAGDNISNSNTVGFKQSRAVFEDVLGGAIGAVGEPGAGVRMVRAQQIFGQGALLSTGRATDIALSGDGFFVVEGTLGGISGNFYTRAGQTSLRNDGTLINPQGLELQGYAAQATGGFSSTLGSIVVPTAALPPRATTGLDVTANLDATSVAPTLPWDAQNPGATSNFSTAMTVYDSLGNAHALSVYFRNTGPGAWEYHALAAGGEVAGGTAGTNVDIANGTLTFNTSGALQATAAVGGGTVDFVGAQPGQALALDFGTSIASGGTGLDGLTQFGAPSAVSAQSQDGYASGDLSGVAVDQDGTVRGLYTNGQRVAVGQLAVAKFRSTEGLGRAGHNLWTATEESGEAALGVAGSGGRGALVSSSLEQSNVDLAQQFVDLIVHQRAYQASSKTIQTADQMMQELINIKQ